MSCKFLGAKDRRFDVVKRCLTNFLVLRRQRIDSHTVTEEQVKLTLASDAQQEMFYGIDKEEKESEQEANDQAAGKKRKYNTLAKIMGDDDSEDDSEDYSSAQGTQLAL